MKIVQKVSHSKTLKAVLASDSFGVFFRLEGDKKKSVFINCTGEACVVDQSLEHIATGLGRVAMYEKDSFEVTL